MCGLRPHRGSYYCCIIVFKLLLLSLHTEVGITEKNQNGYYMISAGEYIFSSRPYGVVVGMFESDSSLSCEVMLKGPRLSMSMEMQLTPMHPMSSYRFQLPELQNGDYTLTVKGLRGMNFTTSKTLTWQIFRNFIKIQTPKTIYWAGELLQFRVIFHNEMLKAASPEYKATIWIEDGRGYRVRLYREIHVVKGVFQSEHLIGRYPNIGDWQICVRNGVHAKEHCAKIRVAYFDPTSFDTKFTPFDENPHHEVRETNEKRLRIHRTAKPKKVQRKIITNNSTIDPVDLKFEKVKRRISDSPCDDSPKLMVRAPKKKLRLPENLIQVDYGTPRETPMPVKFQLEQKLNYLVVVIMFNGMVLASGESYPDRNNTFNMELEITELMWPFVHVVVYGMETGSTVLLVATQTLKIPRGEHNHVQIIAPAVVKPGELITLRVKAVAKSYMGISVVDSRVFSSEDSDFNEHYFDVVMGELLTFPLKAQLTQNPTASKLGLLTLTNAKSISEIKPMNVNATSSFIPKSVFDVRPTQDRRRRRRLKPRTGNVDHFDSNISQIDKTIVPRSIHEAYCCNLVETPNPFQDVMLFETVEDALAGWRNFTVHVPDVFTHWKLNAFLMEPHTGLTLMESETYIDIESTKYLYLEYNVPHHIKIGETVVVPVNCFNKLNTTKSVTIQVKQNQTYFEQLDNNRKAFHNIDYVEQHLQIRSNSNSTFNVYIKAIKGGSLAIQIRAISDTLNDTVTHQIEFQQPGQLITHHEDVFKVMGWRTMRTQFEIQLPHKPSDDGVTCYLSGSPIAANIQALQLIDRTDDGEQVISKLMSVYYVWDFVREKIWINSKWLQHLENQLTDGYQSMQRMRARDGGFSFEEQPGAKCTSVWLTGYALKMLQHLENSPLSFGNRVLVQCENYLLNHRLNRTEFVDKCETPHRRKLTNLELSLDVLKPLQLSIRMIRIQESHSWVSKQLANKLNYQLEAKRGFNLQQWQQPNETTNGNWAEARQNIEIAARILMAQITQKKDVSNEIYRWLIPQLFGQNCRVACFECTMARKAIYNYVRSQTSEPEVNLSVYIVGDIDEQERIRFNATNKYQTQKVQIQAKSQKLNFKVYGLGELLVQCSYEFDSKQLAENDTNFTRSYKMEVTQLKLLKISQSYLKICVSRSGKHREFYIGSDIVLHLPSGYVLSGRSVSRLVGYPAVMQADSKGGNTKLLVRLGPLSKLTCFSVLIILKYKVENLQPGMISVTDTNSLLKPQVSTFIVTF